MFFDEEILLTILCQAKPKECFEEQRSAGSRGSRDVEDDISLKRVPVNILYEVHLQVMFINL